MENYQLALEDGEEVVEGRYAQAVSAYLNSRDRRFPVLLKGDCRDVMAEMPSSSVDCVMTSPPYWGQGEYSAGQSHLNLAEIRGHMKLNHRH